MLPNMRKLTFGVPTTCLLLLLPQSSDNSLMLYLVFLALSCVVDIKPPWLTL
jgi:hypothetical protein